MPVDHDDDYPFLQKKDVQDLREALTLSARATREQTTAITKMTLAIADLTKNTRELPEIRKDTAELPALRKDLNLLLDVLVGKRTNGGTELAGETANEGEDHG